VALYLPVDIFDSDVFPRLAGSAAASIHKEFLIDASPRKCGRQFETTELCMSGSCQASYLTANWMATRGS
jgi:hypothetical protein